MKNVLLYYSFSFALGGGEYLPLSFIAALQKAGKGKQSEAWKAYRQELK